MIAHTGLNVLSDRADGQNAIDLQDIENAFDGFVDQGEVRANLRTGRTPQGDVLGAACGKDLSRIQRGAARPRHPVRPRGLADCVAATETRLPPCVDGQTAVHMLVIDRKLERIAGDVVPVPLVELDRQRVHLAQAVQRRFEQCAALAEVRADVVIQFVETEFRLSGHG